MLLSGPHDIAGGRREKRKGFEDLIRKNRKNLTTWRKYAQWEESQNEIERYVPVAKRFVTNEFHLTPRLTLLQPRPIGRARSLSARSTKITGRQRCTSSTPRWRFA